MDSGFVSVYQISGQLPNWNLISGDGLVKKKKKRPLHRSSQRGSGAQMLQWNPKVAVISECFAVSKSEHGDLEHQCGEWQALGGSSSACYSWHKNLPNLLFVFFFFRKGRRPEKANTFHPLTFVLHFLRRPWFDLVFLSAARNLRQMNQMHTPCWWKPKHWSDLQSTEAQFKCFLSWLAFNPTLTGQRAVEENQNPLQHARAALNYLFIS